MHAILATIAEVLGHVRLNVLMSLDSGNVQERAKKPSLGCVNSIPWNHATYAKSVKICVTSAFALYRARNKGMQILLSNSQAGPGRKSKQEQEEVSRNHVQAFIPGSVC